ncbi:cardiolipin synthase [Mycetocola spongiae]|uniref:cardiolipin synthase n=1 Tax=Mycetocola spongiae TaxID=2859226 RepID=UPI001CF325B1|nr:cardiolipin synthase [Mycetocola spongiae]UCR88514.1 cardiolipin synthase [Mycetocola spongiae]
MTFEPFIAGWGGWSVLYLIIDIAIRIVAVIVVPRNRKPTAGTAWLMLIFIQPAVGMLIFLLIGNPKLPRKRRLIQEEINATVKEGVELLPKQELQPGAPKWFDSLVELNGNLGALPLLGGNTATLNGDYNNTLEQMSREIDTATEYVHIEFYIMSSSEITAEFFDAIGHATARGVKVRVLFDHIASLRSPRYKQTKKRLREVGAEWHMMLPVQPLRGKYQRPDLRNHRKLMIVDGRVGYMGSQNLVDRTYLKRSNLKRGLKWKDLMVRVVGPTVDALNVIFLSDWYAETGEIIALRLDMAEAVPEGTPDVLDCQVVPSGPGFDGENNLRLFLGLLYAAEERIVITSPYFVPDEALMYAVTTAVQRGVPVDLFVSEEGDQAVVFHAQRSYYEELLRAGVRIFMYPAPYILHSKHFTIDDDVAVIGSSNMDMRSFGLNLEVSLLVRGESFVRDMRAIEDEYRAVSRELTLDEWERQPLRSTILDNLARLTSALQ